MSPVADDTLQTYNTEWLKSTASKVTNLWFVSVKIIHSKDCDLLFVKEEEEVNYALGWSHVESTLK